MRRILALLSIVPLVGLSEPAEVVATADHLDCLYASGETARVSFTMTGTNGQPVAYGRVKVSVDNFGTQELAKERIVDLASENPVRISARRETPGFVRIRISTVDPEKLTLVGNGRVKRVVSEYTYGIGYDVGKIVSGTPDVPDFNEFWSAAVERLNRTVPVDAREETVPSENPAFSVKRISVATAQGRRVWGWITEPADASRRVYPMRIEVAGAGVGYGIAHCGESGRIVCRMNVHSYAQPEGLGDAPGEARIKAYEAQNEAFGKPCGVTRYFHAGIHKSREDYFYYASILGLNRMIDYLAGRPNCDPTRITYSGTSQGGGIGLILTYLNRHISRSVIVVPALTDLLGYKAEPGRQSGWPRLVESQRPENREAAALNAPYFCGVNFARRIFKPIRFVAGYADNTCSPNAVYAAFNACPSPDKDILCGIGMGHSTFRDFYDYLSAWEHNRFSAPSAADGRYRFLAFNIWGDFFGNPPEERDREEAVVVRRLNPDFIALQEVTENFWKSRLFTELAGEYEVVGRGIGSAPGSNASNALLYRKSRFVLEDSGAKWFCPELDWSKGVVWAVVRDKNTGRKLALFSTHFWWRCDGRGDDWIRLNNAQFLRETMFAVARKHDAAVVGGGDLNSPMDHQAMRYLLAHGLKSAQESAEVAPREFPSYHGFPLRTPDGDYRGVSGAREQNRANPKMLRIDHIFFDPSRIKVDRFDTDISPLACRVSDHHPIIADFRLLDAVSPGGVGAER